jgi:hypothetical protein
MIVFLVCLCYPSVRIDGENWRDQKKMCKIGFSLPNLASWPYGSLAFAKKYLCEKKKKKETLKIKPSLSIQPEPPTPHSRNSTTED